MKLIKQSAELLPHQDIERQIEIAARTCYKSEDKISEDNSSAKAMLEKLINSKHLSMLEHGTVYLHYKREYGQRNNKISNFFNKYYNNPYSRAKIDFTGVNVYVTTNYRVLYEMGWTKDLLYECLPTPNHVKRYTFRLTTSISIVRELLRHRVFSFANESTRYVNLNKKGEYLFIKPYWFDNTIERCQEAFIDACNQSMYSYQQLLHDGLPPQAAREVLPLCTKSELIMTGFKDDWDNFLDIRLRGTTGKPHPDMVELAKLIEDELNKNK